MKLSRPSSVSLTAPAGTTQSDATPIHLSTTDVYAATVGSGTGYVLPPANAGDEFHIVNGDASNTLKIYPPSGAVINGLSADAAITVRVRQGVRIMCFTPLIYGAIYDSDTDTDTDTDKVILSATKVSTKGSDAEVVRFVAPFAGTISKIWSVLNAALATADATITAAIGVTGVTNGVITVTEAGSAAGDIDSATPTALRTVVAGDLITLTVGGGSTATATCNVQIELTRTI